MTVVALIDGPLPAGHRSLRDSLSFTALHPAVGASPATRHANAMSAAILSHAPQARIDSYAVFPGALTTTADAVVAALRRAAQSDAEIVHCSFGILRDDPGLRAAVAALCDAGKRVVASAPARGQPVYPAKCQGVTAVQGDARCNSAEWSWLGLPNADFGACPTGADPAIRGASIAAAHFTGLLACRMQAGRRDRMVEDATFRGRERIVARPARTAMTSRISEKEIFR